MTSGTKSRDDHYIVTYRYPTCDGLSTDSDGIGTSETKTWSGSDSPKQEKQNRILLDFSYPIFDRKGRFLRNKRKIVYDKPKYKTSKRTGDHPYSATIRFRADALGIWETKCAQPGVSPPTAMWIRRPYGTVSRPNYYNGVPFPWSNEDTSALYGKLAARLGSGFNLATFLGEGKEALKTIATLSTRLYRAYRFAKKGKVGKAWNALRGARNSPLPDYIRTNPGMNRKNFASLWLELQYGWLPLLSDIGAAVKHLAYSQNRNFNATYRVRHSKTIGGPYKASPYIIGGSHTRTVQVIAKITAINQARLLGLTDPRATAWELVPFSFIADWFIPIGNYLEEMNLANSLTGTFVVTTKDTVLTTSHIYPRDSLSGAALYFTRRDITLNRTVDSAMPRPMLPQLKSLDSVASWKHAVNAVALIIQKMRF